MRCSCDGNEHPETVQASIDEHHENPDNGGLNTQDHIDKEFDDWEEFLENDFWLDRILPGLMMMTEQITTAGAWQMTALGVFLDAKQQLEVQRLLQGKMADAHKDYHVSTGMCVIGTNVRSLAAAQHKAEANTHIMAQRALARQTGNANVNAAEGQHEDRGLAWGSTEDGAEPEQPASGRLLHFYDRFCDPHDLDEGYGAICPERPAGDADNNPAETYNRDIDYASTVEKALTLDVDFTNNDTTLDEESIFALASNLYSHDVTSRILLSDQTDPVKRQEALFGLRSIMAKRTVAEMPFHVIVGMRTPGGEGSIQISPYMQAVLMEMGVPEEEITEIAHENPSYNEQMKFLTQTLYQTPDFYTNLYDKPTNVDRKGAALQAIGLMQDFDRLESYLRTEMMLSLLLELEIVKLQREVEGQISTLRSL